MICETEQTHISVTFEKFSKKLPSLKELDIILHTLMLASYHKLLIVIIMMPKAKYRLISEAQS